MASLISAAQKDVILDYLISQFEVGAWAVVSNDESLCGFSPNVTEAIISQFMRLGLVTEQSGSLNDYRFVMNIEAHDFKRRGGFAGQELLFQNTVEKLLLEVDKLTATDPELQPRFAKIKENIKEFITVLTNIATIGGAAKDILPDQP